MKSLIFSVIVAITMSLSTFGHDSDWWCDCWGTTPGYGYTTGGNTSGTVGTYQTNQPVVSAGNTGYYTNTATSNPGGTLGQYQVTTNSVANGTTGEYQNTPGNNPTGGTIASYKETPRLAITLSGVITTQGGTPGTTYAVEASDDLVHWVKVGEVTSDLSGNQNFTVTLDAPKRFYRVSH
jgi:hypothetical protein